MSTTTRKPKGKSMTPSTISESVNDFCTNPTYEESKAAYIGMCNEIMRRTKPCRLFSCEEKPKYKPISREELSLMDSWYTLYTHVHSWPFEHSYDEPC